MELSQFPEIAGFVGLVLWSLSERGFSLTKQAQTSGRRHDRGSFWLMNLAWYATIFYALADAWVLQWTTFGEGLKSLQYVGVFLVMAGLVFRFFARRALGKQYSVYVQTSGEHQLITSGIYRLVRHPAYLGTLLLIFGIPICEGSWAGIFCALVAGLPAVIFRIRVEEQALSEWFGDAYTDYQSKTWRLIPYIW